MCLVFFSVFLFRSVVIERWGSWGMHNEEGTALLPFGNSGKNLLVVHRTNVKETNLTEPLSHSEDDDIRKETAHTTHAVSAFSE